LSGSGLPEPTIHALHPLLGSRRYTIGKLGRRDEIQTMVVLGLTFRAHAITSIFVSAETLY
jgi:hypothetical protein